MGFKAVVTRRSDTQWTLKPQDLLVGFALACQQGSLDDRELGMSTSGLRDSMQRLMGARLAVTFDGGIHIVMPAFRPFVTCAAVYCFPAVLGLVVHGHKTGIAEDWPIDIDPVVRMVWPDESGSSVGRSILPLHPCAPVASRNIPGLSQCLWLFDVARTTSGKTFNHAISRLSLSLSGN